MPWVTVSTYPYALPMAITDSPGIRSDEEPMLITVIGRSGWILMIARSVSGSWQRILAMKCSSPAVVTWISCTPSTTW